MSRRKSSRSIIFGPQLSWSEGGPSGPRLIKPKSLTSCVNFQVVARSAYGITWVPRRAMAFQGFCGSSRPGVAYRRQRGLTLRTIEKALELGPRAAR